MGDLAGGTDLQPEVLAELDSYPQIYGRLVDGGQEQAFVNLASMELDSPDASPLLKMLVEAGAVVNA